MRSSRYSSFLAPLLLLGAHASPLEQRGSGCNANNCYRQVFASNYPSRPTRADCSSFLAATVTPATVTFTSTATVTDTACLTESETTTNTKLATDTVYTTLTVTDSPSASSSSVVLQPPEKRAVASIPAYASGCSSAAAYSSACSCLGIQPFTVTAAAPSTTVVVSATVSTTVLATAVSSVTITERVTVTSTATAHVTALTTVTSCAAPAFSPAACLVSLPSYCSRLNDPGMTLGFAALDLRPGILSSCSAPWRATDALWAQVASCFPAGYPSYIPSSDTTPTIPIYNCLVANGLCKFTPACTTEVYPVGGAPTGIAPAPAPTNNLFANGGFESGALAPFVLGAQNSDRTPLQVSVASGNAHTGSRSLKVYFDDANGEGVGMSQTVAVQPNATYAFSAWAYQTNAVANCGFTLYTSPSPGLSYTQRLVGQAQGEWMYVEQTFTTAASEQWVWVGFSCNAGTVPPYTNDPNYRNTFWLDDLSLTMVAW